MLIKTFKPLLFSFLLLLCGCKPVQPLKNSSVLKIDLNNDPHSLDPRIARDTYSITLVRMFFEGLTRMSPQQKPALALAESVSISEDLKTYTFTLKDAVWSNGDPIKASDFIYSWMKTLSKDFPSSNAFYLYVLKNAKQIKAGTLPKEALGAFALNASTLVIELEHPTPYFLELLTFPVFFPVHANNDVSNPNWPYQLHNYICNGPFILKEWLPHNQIYAKKNKTYWDNSAVSLNGIKMVMVPEDTALKLFEKKKLHWVGSPLSTLPLDALDTLKHVHAQESLATSFIRLNVKHPFLQNQEIRKALSFALNREEIVKEILRKKCLPATTFVPPSLLPDEQAFVPDNTKIQAQIALQNGMEELNLANRPSFTLSYFFTERTHLIAQVLQQQWKEVLGIDIQLERMESKVYFDSISKQNYQLALSSWSADFHDPLSFLEIFKYQTQSTNNTNWHDPTYTKILDQCLQEPSKEKRDELFLQCEKILLKAKPIIPLYHSCMLYLKDEQLEDVFLSPLGNIDFKWAKFKTNK